MSYASNPDGILAPHLVFGDSLTPDLWIFRWSILATTLIALVVFGVQVLIVFRHAKAAIHACGVALVLAIVLAPLAIQASSINDINLSIAVACLAEITSEAFAKINKIEMRLGYAPSRLCSIIR